MLVEQEIRLRGNSFRWLREFIETVSTKTIYTVIQRYYVKSKVLYIILR